MSTKNNILLVGGAGYIGSHTALELKRKGYNVFILDNLSYGNKDLLLKLDCPYQIGDISDKASVIEILKKEKITSVMHFSAFAYVGESVVEPLKYYRNNFAATVSLLEAVQEVGVKNFIFSSTCATYGTPEKLPINEATKQNPINPYGFSKLFVEQALKDCQKAFNLNYVIFRYFNAAGADRAGEIGERHNPETHLIPLTIDSANNGSLLKVFGGDYPTQDGTCIRDYIHVSDIASAHILGLDYLNNGGKSDIFNIGTGNGFSNLEIIKKVEEVSGKKVNYQITARREGDPAVLVAAADKIKSVLKWKDSYSSLDNIISSAYNWHLKDAFTSK